MKDGQAPQQIYTHKKIFKSIKREKAIGRGVGGESLRVEEKKRDETRGRESPRKQSKEKGKNDRETSKRG